MSRRTEPRASPQPVFDCLGLLFAKGTQWVCGGVEEIGVRSVAGSMGRYEYRVRTVANGHAVFKTREPAINFRCPPLFVP